MNRPMFAIPRLAGAAAWIIAGLILTTHITAAGPLPQWDTDVLVASGEGDQGLLQPLVVSDGHQGAFVVWKDRMRQRVRIRRLAGDGSKPWPAAIEPATTSYPRLGPAAIADGQGGLFVAWLEARVGGCFLEVQVACDIYAQHIDGEGHLLWGNGGRPVTRAPANQGVTGIGLARDGAGGLYLAWDDARPDCCKVYAQHLDAAGKPLWAEDGIRLSPEPYIIIGALSMAPIVVADGAGGALVLWLENQYNPSSDSPPLKLQRLDAQGRALWAEYGITIGKPQSTRAGMVADGAGGALIVYTVGGWEKTYGTAVQKVRDDGTLAWGETGALAGLASYYHEAPAIIADRRGGVFVAWVDHVIRDFSEETDIRAQRLDPDGVPLWPAEGRRISGVPGEQDNLRMLADGKGGAYLFWRDCRDYPERDPCFDNADIYGQHLRNDGKRLWRIDGAPVSAAAGNQGVPQGTPVFDSSIGGAPDGAGGVILAWPDGRKALCENAIWTTDCDVRAQRVKDAPAAAGVEPATRLR